MRPVIPHRMMLYAAIVPERDRVFLPAKPALEQRVRHVLVEILQNAGALVARYAVDVAGESLVDIECLAAGHGVGADHRMVGKGVALLVLDPVIGVLAAIMLAVMAGGKTLEIALHRRRTYWRTRCRRRAADICGCRGSSPSAARGRTTHPNASLRHWRAGCLGRRG